jgi:DNA polymerase-3 subunit delta
MSSRKRSDSGSAKSGPAKPPPTVVLIVGEQDTLREAAVAELAREVLGDAPRDFDEDRFDLATAVDPVRVLDAARTLPVLAPRRLVRLRGVSERRAARFLDDALMHYLDDPVESTCLLLEATKVDKRLKWVKRLAQVGEVREARGPSRPAEVRRWVEQRIRDLGKKPAAGASAALLDAIGADLDRLERELEKACLFAGEREDLTAEDVAEVTGEVRPRALYQLTDAIGSRDLPSALRLSGELLDQGEAPLALVTALANHFRRLVRARECRPLEPRTVARDLALHPYAAERLTEQARRFDLPRLLRSLEQIRRADEALKGAEPLPPRLAIERLVLNVGGARAAIARRP